MSSTPILSPAPRLALNVSTLGLGFAVLVQAVLVVLVFGALFARVSAMEQTIEPVRQGKIAVLDERTQRIEGDVRWIRDRLERDK